MHPSFNQSRVILRQYVEVSCPAEFTVICLLVLIHLEIKCWISWPTDGERVSLSHFAAQAGFEHMILLSQPPSLLGLQACASRPSRIINFLLVNYDLVGEDYWKKFKTIKHGIVCLSFPHWKLLTVQRIK